MNDQERKRLDDCIQAVARVALWLAGDIVPDSLELVEHDLDLFEELAWKAETKLHRERGSLPDEDDPEES